MSDAQPGRLEPAAPLGDGVRADVAGIAPFLEAVEEGVEVGIVGRHLVVEQEAPTRLEHACDLADERVRVGEMMRRDATRDQIEARGLERQRLCRRLDEGDVGGAALRGERLRELEHARCEIAGHDLRDVRCERECGVPRAGGDVEHPLAPAGRREFDEPSQVVAGGMTRALLHSALPPRRTARARRHGSSLYPQRSDFCLIACADLRRREARKNRGSFALEGQALRASTLSWSMKWRALVRAHDADARRYTHVSQDANAKVDGDGPEEIGRSRFLAQATIVMGGAVGLGLVIPIGAGLWPKPELINANKGCVTLCRKMNSRRSRPVSTSPSRSTS